MNQLNLLKLKRYFYLTFGILFDLSLIFLSGYAAYLIPKDIGNANKLGFYTVVFLLFLLFIVISMVIVGVIEHFTGEKVYPPTSAVFSIKKDNKYIYDSDRGYYLAMVDEEDTRLKLKIYKQNFFSMIELFEIDLASVRSEDEMKKTLKTYFDNIESENNSKIPKRKYHEQYGHFKNWDGYVDKQSRRDGILDKLLK
jgi:hypothetical protein